jgi:hypothetical protein
MYEDRLQYIIDKHINDFDPASEEMALGRIEDVNYDSKLNEEFKKSIKQIKILSQTVKLN